MLLNEMTLDPDVERFQSGAAKYAAYLETPGGRLRTDLTFANVQELLPRARTLRALDIGGGTGALSVRLAQLGCHVTLLDSSPEMLEFAKYATQQAGVTEKITLKHGDATRLAALFEAESFDLVLCHNILEYLDDSGAVLRGAARSLKDSSGLISVLVRNQAGEVLKAAIKDGELAAAEDCRTADWGHESLYGGRVRLFTPEVLRSMLISASLTVIAERGVRVVSDYLPPRASCNYEYERIFELERRLGRRPEFAAVARYLHVLARRAVPAKSLL